MQKNVSNFQVQKKKVKKTKTDAKDVNDIEYRDVHSMTDVVRAEKSGPPIILSDSCKKIVTAKPQVIKSGGQVYINPSFSHSKRDRKKKANQKNLITKYGTLTKGKSSSSTSPISTPRHTSPQDTSENDIVAHD